MLQLNLMGPVEQEPTPPVEPSKNLDVKPKAVAKQATKDKPKSSNS